MRDHTKQIAASRRSNWRGGTQTGSGSDHGQRYVIHYKDGMGQDRIFGYCDTEGARDKLIAAIAKHPIWKDGRYEDRGVK